MADILPPAAPHGQPPNLPDRMSRLDACIDACGNTETPYRIELEDDGFRAFYGCTDCGQFWNTSWKDVA